MDDFESIYPACRAAAGEEAWRRALSACIEGTRPADLAEALAPQVSELALPEFLPDLARLEWARHAVATAGVEVPRRTDADRYEINPTLEVVRLGWKLVPLLVAKGDAPAAEPEAAEQWALIWRDPRSGETCLREAANEDLLAVKLIVEGISPEEAATSGDATPEAIEAMLARAASEGLLIPPHSRIRRDTAAFADPSAVPEQFIEADAFTLQWHITHACDLHCKHCYDRSRRSPLTLEQGLGVLDDMRAFCRERRVRGHVCFTGGNPLMYPHFFELYRGAAQRGFGTSILGNPAPKEKVQQIVDIQRPGLFQVSLEGLREHNDYIRGAGNFARVMDFLGVLRELGVPSGVMLTLTADNIDQVLPLAELLRDRADRFTFNRLSPVGEGASLLLPSRERYAEFLEQYVDAAGDNPIMGFKDNLINVELRRRGREPFDGCTGYGCGAAFNFLALLPDGEAHACRKFPSPLGNVLEQGIAGVYDSELAERYRQGSAACAGCDLRHVCGGCMAIARGLGLDIFTERDPYCTFEHQPAEAREG